MIIDFETTVQRLRDCEDVLILTHMNPDGDTLGSGFALLRGLRALGKRVTLQTEAPIPARYAFLAPETAAPVFTPQYIISMDVADKALLEKGARAVYGDRVDLSIDHHGRNRVFAKETYVESDSASAGEIIFLLLTALGVPITPEIADCLYTACATDTGCFCYSNVTARTHRIAAELIAAGADHAHLNVRLFETKSRGFIQLQRLCLDTMELLDDGALCIFTITRAMLEDTGCSEADLDELVGLTRQIEGVRIGVTLKERPDGGFKVSLRTHEDIDAAALCAVLGGGGHRCAAGCSFNGTRGALLEKLLPILRGALKEEAAQ